MLAASHLPSNWASMGWFTCSKKLPKIESFFGMEWRKAQIIDLPCICLAEHREKVAAGSQDIQLEAPGDIQLAPPGDIQLAPPGDIQLEPPGDIQQIVQY